MLSKMCFWISINIAYFVCLPNQTYLTQITSSLTETLDLKWASHKDIQNVQCWVASGKLCIITLFQSRQECENLAKGITSLILWSPRMHCMYLSKPIPNPPWGTEPNSLSCRYLSITKMLCLHDNNVTFFLYKWQRCKATPIHTDPRK